jgi:hypothetical protein
MTNAASPSATDLCRCLSSTFVDTLALLLLFSGLWWIRCADNDKRCAKEA